MEFQGLDDLVSLSFRNTCDLQSWELFNMLIYVLHVLQVFLKHH
jgi:hypothetical protein